MTYTFDDKQLYELLEQAAESGARKALNKPEREWLNANEVAEMMGYDDPRTVRENIISGKWNIVWKEQNRRYKFKRISVEKYINQTSVL